MGYHKDEDGDICHIDGIEARSLRVEATYETYQPKKGETFYYAGANGTVCKAQWFKDTKLMLHVALMRIGNVHPTKGAANAWFEKYGDAFLENVHDL